MAAGEVAGAAAAGAGAAGATHATICASTALRCAASAGGSFALLAERSLQCEHPSHVAVISR